VPGGGSEGLAEDWRAWDIEAAAREEDEK
jgi:hypothetical protein